MVPTIFDHDERDLIVALAGCSLDEKPGKNWVESAGGLPEYICEVARAIKRSGKTTSQAIAIAVSRMKKWATGVGVDNDTQAKAAKALAEWEALRAKSKAKTGAKKSAHALAASAGSNQVLCLTDYNMDTVRSAFQARLSTLRDAYRKANPGGDFEAGGLPYLYVQEVWNNFIIAQSDYGADADLYKVPYTVDANGDVTFGDAVEVRQQYIEVTDDDLGVDATADKTLAQIAAMTHTNRILARHQNAGTALSRVLAFCSSPTCDGEPEQTGAGGDGQQLGVDGTAPAAAEYADPGHQGDGKPRYQLRTPKQITAAWAMINQKLNENKYEPWQLAQVKANIQAAAHRHQLDLFALSAVLDANPATARILALSAGEKEYANTPGSSYADPGYQEDGKKRYPIDTADKVRSAWSYVNQQGNASKYSPADLAKVKGRIKAAAKKFGIDIAT